jgi:hypothetical protein
MGYSQTTDKKIAISQAERSYILGERKKQVYKTHGNSENCRSTLSYLPD